MSNRSRTYIQRLATVVGSMVMVTIAASCLVVKNAAVIQLVLGVFPMFFLDGFLRVLRELETVPPTILAVSVLNVLVSSVLSQMTIASCSFANE